MDRKQTPHESSYVDGLIDRLLELYLARAPVPGSDSLALSDAHFFRLCRALRAEGYGDAAVIAT